jgi:hypothetical protein
MLACVLPAIEDTTPAEPRRVAEARLRRSGYSALGEIRCEVAGQAVRLIGRVPSYYLKQLAQAIVCEALDDHVVLNQIEVVSPPARRPEGASRPAWREHPEPSPRVKAEAPASSHPKTQL